MTKRNSILIASWTKDQDPLVDSPSSLTQADGTPISIDDYESHLSDTFSWDLEAVDGPRRIIQPSLVATARYDLIAGAWIIGGRGIPRSVLDIDDPHATDAEIAEELCDWPKVFRLNIKRPNSNPGAARNHAAIHRERKSISLFWIESFQRIHDWLIFATSLRVAASYHRETFNCAIDSPKCHRVLQRVSPCPFYSGDAPCYAATRDLEQLGFHVLDAPGIQAIRLGHLVYVQGHFYQTVSEMRDDQMEAKTGERPCGTVRWPPPLQF